MITVGQCKFNFSKKYTNLVSDVDNGREYTSVGAVGMWEICLFLSILLKT